MVTLFKYWKWPHTQSIGVLRKHTQEQAQLFLDVYVAVDTDDKSEIKLSIDFEQYCIDHIHGVVKVKSEFELGVLAGAKIYFKDDASLAWYKMKYE